jgi:uncharacterized membrane protein
MSKTKNSVQKIALGAIFTALVVILQWVGSVTTFFGPFSTAVGLIPIVLGACMCGPLIGGWLGLVFGMVVLMTGGAALFFAFDVPGTIITVLGKGLACGLVAGLVYKLLSRFDKTIAALVSAIACPVVNTAVFLLGCFVFFMDSADAIAANVGLSVSGMALFWALAMGNFVLEVLSNAVLSPVIVRIIQMFKK